MCSNKVWLFAVAARFLEYVIKHTLTPYHNATSEAFVVPVQGFPIASIVFCNQIWLCRLFVALSANTTASHCLVRRLYKTVSQQYFVLSVMHHINMSRSMGCHFTVYFISHLLKGVKIYPPPHQSYRGILNHVCLLISVHFCTITLPSFYWWYFTCSLPMTWGGIPIDFEVKRTRSNLGFVHKYFLSLISTFLLPRIILKAGLRRLKQRRKSLKIKHFSQTSILLGYLILHASVILIVGLQL